MKVFLLAAMVVAALPGRAAITVGAWTPLYRGVEWAAGEADQIGRAHV